jgi:hypothetical protein
MRAIIWLTALLAALYGGYWFVGSRAVLMGANEALGGMKAEGLADYSGLDLAGFPSRFDLTISDPKLVSADGQTGWAADFLQIFALSYRPNQIIAVWPPKQSLALGRETLAIETSDMRASVAFTAGLSLPLDHSELEGHDLVVTSDFGWSVLAKKLVFASRQSPKATYAHEVVLVVTDPAPGDKLRRLIDPMGRLPAQAGTLQVDATPVFDRPVDRSAIQTPPRVTAIQDIALQIGWGAMNLDAHGDLTVDGQGYAAGKIQLSARGWREIFALFVDTGAVKPEIAPTIEKVLAELAKTSGEADLLVLPLVFDKGRARLGPIPLGKAPRF